MSEATTVESAPQTETTVDGIPTSSAGGLAANNGQATNSSSSTSDPLETAKWTRFLPESFGIRDSVRDSSYRWCVREG